jgi:hypothetical protein
MMECWTSQGKLNRSGMKSNPGLLGSDSYSDENGLILRREESCRSTINFPCGIFF